MVMSVFQLHLFRVNGGHLKKGRKVRFQYRKLDSKSMIMPDLQSKSCWKILILGPQEYKGDAASRLPVLLDKVRGEQLGISLLFDSHFCSSAVEPQTSSHNLPSTQCLQETVRAFKNSLQLSPEKAHEIECSTRQQHSSQLWFDVRRYRITASIFGHVLSRRVNTPPDNLVLRIIQPKKFSTLVQRRCC